MPWKIAIRHSLARRRTVTSTEEITRFILLARSGRFTIANLCEQFGISRSFLLSSYSGVSSVQPLPEFR
jgi:hypothetical protein